MIVVAEQEVHGASGPAHGPEKREQLLVITGFALAVCEVTGDEDVGEAGGGGEDFVDDRFEVGRHRDAVVESGAVGGNVGVCQQGPGVRVRAGGTGSCEGPAQSPSEAAVEEAAEEGSATEWGQLDGHGPHAGRGRAEGAGPVRVYRAFWAPEPVEGLGALRFSCSSTAWVMSLSPLL